ncbi:hypothetical protein AB1K56_12660 [Microbacterium sp. BWR-S6Y]|uniref:hypothetical protein n=1 Tax=Microbacterium sp. BWR-S6Y TaxID=3232073 RepID=UPI003528FBC6
MLRLLASAALGAAIGGLIVSLLGRPDPGMLILGIALGVFLATTTVIRLAGGLAVATPSPAAVREARDGRRLGRARVDAVRQTGTFLNEQPVCDIDVTVAALTGDAWATTVRRIVPLTELPAYRTGCERDVAILIDGGPEIAFADGELSPAEIERLVVPPRSDVPLRPVPPGTRIGGGRRRGPLIGVGRRGRPLRLTLFALVAVGAASVVVLPFRAAVVPTLEAWADGRASVDLRQPDEIETAARALREAIGHDRVVAITVLPDAVVVDAPISVGAVETDEWTYRGGRVDHDGPARPQPELAAEQFSWDDVSLERLWPAMRSAADESGLPVGDAVARVVRSTDTDVQSDTFIRAVGPPEMTFSLSDDYRDAFFRLSAQGVRLDPAG